MGSVKDLTVIQEPSSSQTGKGRFVFSDRYSVFDWGQMPDNIENKGKALCVTGGCFFEKIEQMGIKTHYLGLVQGEEVRSVSELDTAVDKMEVKLVRVVKPRIEENGYDYSCFKKEEANFLIPIEVIYRNTLPEGSSVFRRLKEGTLKLDDIGLKEMPEPGRKLDIPLLDVSTKLESIDRYLSWDEAKDICGLSDKELEEIKSITLKVNGLISEEVERLGLVNHDGKMEFAFDENRNIILVDVVGTLDECRFTYKDIPLSKEIARIFYRKTPWYQEVTEVKTKNPIDWKNHVKSVPQPLPQEYSRLISAVYQTFCNEVTGKKCFNTGLIGDIMGELDQVIKG
jgi:phosphoribosylaminoimidazole-succinocarboxamide synthase